eukprot:7379732-Prymnesium_polylepis.1
MAGNCCSSNVLFDEGSLVKIELIEEYPCSNRMELNRREGEWIRNTKCVNKAIAGRTAKEYYEDNQDKIKDYREENKEQINAKKKEYREKSKEKIKEASKNYYAANKDKKKEYNEAHKAHIKEYKKNYYDEKKIAHV